MTSHQRDVYEAAINEFGEEFVENIGIEITEMLESYTAEESVRACEVLRKWVNDHINGYDASKWNVETGCKI